MLVGISELCPISYYAHVDTKSREIYGCGGALTRRYGGALAVSQVCYSLGLMKCFSITSRLQGVTVLWRSPRSKTKKAPEFDWKCIEWGGKGGKRGYQLHRAEVHYQVSNVFRAVNEDYDAAVKFFEAGELNDGTEW